MSNKPPRALREALEQLGRWAAIAAKYDQDERDAAFALIEERGYAVVAGPQGPIACASMAAFGAVQHGARLPLPDAAPYVAPYVAPPDPKPVARPRAPRPSPSSVTGPRGSERAATGSDRRAPRPVRATADVDEVVAPARPAASAERTERIRH